MKPRATHVRSELLVLGVIVFPVISIMASLIGLTLFYMGNRGAALWICAITWGTTMVMTPIAIRTLSRPEASVIPDCNKNGQPMQGHCLQKDQRRHAGYRVNYPATFSNDRICGFGMIEDLSAGGCRVKIGHPLPPGVVGKLLIMIPGGNAPLEVSNAKVRWVVGDQCGLEFITFAQGEQSFLQRITELARKAELMNA